MADISANIVFSEQINRILTLPSPLQKLDDARFTKHGIDVFVKRDDLIHPEISGNKWRKLKYNLLDAQNQGVRQIITFGGAYSNHIYATAASGKYFGFETIGIIRGDELSENSSETLRFAAECGMKLHFVSRTAYRTLRENPASHSLNNTFSHSKLIPEGGTSPLALGGVGEMVDEIVQQLGQAPDYIFCPVGTAGTISGIIAKTTPKTKVIGVCVLKNGQYLLNEIDHLLEVSNVNRVQNPVNVNLEILWNEHHGGYAKKTPELIDFVSKFNDKNDFEIEPIYSGKMFFAFYKYFLTMIKPQSKVVLIHTGGLQGFIH
ncbi:MULTISPECIES: 1-aminocyclopropane-1-carboxylate deaminase/D-cysteine desulfhydrase [Emticicia]|uniref:1-aminocyclopropane-1-carboxylate deaminase/D-cysteine desulfhydrase n=1 Tax=Emticicia TaxID=312278 RepID=UPI0007D8ACF1|nr:MULTISPECIES: pyridoxal-phosphate dependent enzyme [Emticicia]